MRYHHPRRRRRLCRCHPSTPLPKHPRAFPSSAAPITLLLVNLAHHSCTMTSTQKSSCCGGGLGCLGFLVVSSRRPSPSRGWPRRGTLQTPPAPSPNVALERAAVAVGVALWVVARGSRVECACKHACFKWVLAPCLLGLYTLYPARAGLIGVFVDRHCSAARSQTMEASPWPSLPGAYLRASVLRRQQQPGPH